MTHSDNNKLTTLKQLLTEALLKQGETFEQVIATNITFLHMCKQFEGGYSYGVNRLFGHALTRDHHKFAWTERSVYVLEDYDGLSEFAWCPRHPTPDAISYVQQVSG